VSKINRPSSRNGRPSRPRWLIPAVVGGAILLILGAVALILGARREAFVPQVTGAARAEVDATTVDLGSFPFNAQAESVTRVRNVGDEPLYILGEPRVELIEGC
jgi:hypothetical protein